MGDYVLAGTGLLLPVSKVGYGMVSSPSKTSYRQIGSSLQGGTSEKSEDHSRSIPAAEGSVTDQISLFGTSSTSSERTIRPPPISMSYPSAIPVPTSTITFYDAGPLPEEWDPLLDPAQEMTEAFTISDHHLAEVLEQCEKARLVENDRKALHPNQSREGGTVVRVEVWSKDALGVKSGKVGKCAWMGKDDFEDILERTRSLEAECRTYMSNLEREDGEMDMTL